MNFGFSGIQFQDLYTNEGLCKIEEIFCDFLKDNHPQYVEIYQQRFSLEDSLDAKAISNFITSFAPIVEEFIAKLFLCKHSSLAHKKLADKYHVLEKFKRNFIQRKVAKFKGEVERSRSIEELEKLLDIKELNDLDLALKLLELLDSEQNAYEEDIMNYCLLRIEKEHDAPYPSSILFKLPKGLDFEELVHTQKNGNLRYIDEAALYHRSGFDLTDKSLTYDSIKDNISYCLYCHNRGKDSCSIGFAENTTKASIQSEAERIQYRKNALDIDLKGCPLEEKISEMNYLADQGIMIGALAAAAIDNPMLAATGHRICNDCMKSCIYQKQEPVDIPKVETGILNEVLKLDYGFEIYSLLTRWNPLNYRKNLHISSWDAKAQNGKRKHTVLVAGLGPAGFTLCHYLLNSGCDVVAIDGLKIESLPEEISGIGIDGNRDKFKPIKRIEDLYEPLSTRTPYGFGGVAEYGITVRWNKNYLKIIRLLLERRSNFRMYGSIRLGSNISIQQALDFGISHIALCFGAGSPKILPIPNILAKGVRTASDFLMNLQLGGAARNNSNTNLQVRMPIAIIGGGLTAIDTATEALEYYVTQVFKTLDRYEEIGSKIFDNMSQEESSITKEFISHAKLLRDNPSDKYKILRNLGGATVCYRKRLNESTAYKLNHEEVSYALHEGIHFAEDIVPLSIEVDSNRNAIGIRHKNGLFEAHSIFIATGTKPNTILSREVEGIELDGMYFKKDMNYSFTNPKGDVTSVILKHDKFRMSFFGDLHPQYAGNVVKAMASAKDGYSSIIKSLRGMASQTSFDKIIEKMDNALLASVVEVNILAPKIVEIVIHSKSAALNFRPGQFYRVQNFESLTPSIDTKDSKQKNFNPHFTDDFKPFMEPLALTGASACSKTGLLSLIVLEMGGSSDFCKYLKKGEYISMMGPTGTPTSIPKNKDVILIGGGLGNAVLFSIGKACRENGCNVLYFAGYRKLENIFKREEIEACANQVIWCCDEAEPEARRASDLLFHGNMIDAIRWYSESEDADYHLDLFDHLIVIGSDQMMAAVAYNVKHDMKNLFSNLQVAIASINSPMQCMMKEICAQCLQKHVDPLTGKENYVYSCFNQDQKLEEVDFAHLADRLSQNSASEKIFSNWLSYICD